MVDEERYFEKYVEGWNTHDPDMVVEQFADGGTFTDPYVEEPLQGDEIGDYVAETIEGFPDVQFEDRVMPTEIDGEFGLVAEWTMRGTHTGNLDWLPPTGRTIELDGVDVVEFSDDGIAKITGYYDQKEFAEQLGLTFPSVIGQLPSLAGRVAKQKL